MDMNNKRKHLEFIQGVITRMASNLFFLRGWVITLIAGLVSFFLVQNTNNNLVYLLLISILIFWVMDGYFLSQERLFRALYNDIRKKSEEDIDFSMNTNKYKKYKNNTLIYAMFSLTLRLFYIPLITMVLVIVYLIN